MFRIVRAGEIGDTATLCGSEDALLAKVKEIMTDLAVALLNVLGYKRWEGAAAGNEIGSDGD